MPANLRDIRKFPELVSYLETELEWPIEQNSFEDLTFEYIPAELGLKEEDAVKVRKIHQLRPLATGQPWGVFFVEFEKKKLPVVVLRRILSHLVIKKRAAANKSDRAAWNPNDLLFISAYGEESADAREIAFAHFHQQDGDLPTLQVLGWDGGDTVLKLEHVAGELREKLHWPANPTDHAAWRTQWSRAFRHRLGHTVRTSDDLAEVLAALARGIRERCAVLMRAESDRGPLTKLFNAFQAALIHDLTEDRFADTYAQTITYGLLTAAINRTDMSGGTEATYVKADDLTLMVRVTSPFLKEMLETFLTVGGRKNGVDFDELGIQDVVELLRGNETDLPAILRDFGNRTRGEDPVIHFYEHFLSAYNKKLKIQRGVFYTPQPVVSYIVRSVHELLQSEFGLEDGLASTVTWREMLQRHKDLKLPTINEPGEPENTISPDEPFVQILDPATGTATFLVEVVDVIHRTLTAKWKEQGHLELEMPRLWNEYVPKHLLPRLHGYELLAAPYAIAHLKLGLKLTETGYRFGSDERARIYLTNALEPKVRQLPQIGFEPLAHEAKAVNEIKWYKRFTVLIGNPPYSIQSQNLTGTARAWVDPYRYLDGELIKEKGALQFEKALQEDCVKFASFSQRQIIESATGVLGFIMSHSFVFNPTLRGMRQSLGRTFNTINVFDLHGNSTTKERCPDGSEDKNVFDIKQGVGIMVAARQSEPSFATVRYSEAWGTRESKYELLLKTSVSSTEFQNTQPTTPDYLFKPQSADAREEFNSGVKVTEVFIKGNVGIITARDNLAIDFEADPLVERATMFRDSRQSDESLCEMLEISLKKGWDISRAREQIKRDNNLAQFVKPLCYRPFDSRRIFYHPSLVWGMSYPTMQHMLPGGNLAMMIGRAGQVIGQGDWNIVFCTRGLTEFNLYRRGGHNLLPLYLVPEEGSAQGELAGHGNWRPNFSRALLKALSAALKLPQQGAHGLPEGVTPEDIFQYAYAVFHSPGYRSRYAEFLKIDFPRLPLTRHLELFRALARLGGELVALHLLESPKLDQPITEYLGGRAPEVEKVSWSKNTVWLDKAQTAGFKGVSEDVWNFHIGGYQVCEKWLKDRKGRSLSAEDRTHYQKIVVALSETIRLMAEIDEIIAEHGGWPLK